MGTLIYGQPEIQLTTWDLQLASGGGQSSGTELLTCGI